MIEELKPQSLFQEYLVKRITDCLWRSRRVIKAETARINQQLENFERLVQQDVLRGQLLKSDKSEIKEDLDAIRTNLISMRSLPDLNSSFNILRNEIRLDRQLARTFDLLRHLQESDNSKAGKKQKKGPRKRQNKPISRKRLN